MRERDEGGTLVKIQEYFLVKVTNDFHAVPGVCYHRRQQKMSDSEFPTATLELRIDSTPVRRYRIGKTQAQHLLVALTNLEALVYDLTGSEHPAATVEAILAALNHEIHSHEEEPF